MKKLEIDIPPLRNLEGKPVLSPLDLKYKIPHGTRKKIEKQIARTKRAKAIEEASLAKVTGPAQLSEEDRAHLLRRPIMTDHRKYTLFDISETIMGWPAGTLVICGRDEKHLVRYTQDKLRMANRSRDIELVIWPLLDSRLRNWSRLNYANVKLSPLVLLSPAIEDAIARNVQMDYESSTEGRYDNKPVSEAEISETMLRLRSKYDKLQDEENRSIASVLVADHWTYEGVKRFMRVYGTNWKLLRGFIGIPKRPDMRLKENRVPPAEGEGRKSS